jgi:catechol 2,3-dioxygenase-like lactoylglutathione lyase family enzyme
MKLLIAALLVASCLLPGQEVRRPAIVGVAHISVFAHDLQKSEAYYRQLLGFDLPYSLKNADGTTSMDFFKINDRQYIELAPEKQPNSDRLNHIALETNDADAMRLYLKSRGLKTPEQTPKGRIGNLNFMIKDPEGHDVEIVQYGADSWTAQNYGRHLSTARISTHMMHVGIIVTKFEEETRFYQDVLGFKEIWRGSSDGKTLSWTNLQVPDGSDYIEFMLFKEAPEPAKRGAAHHLALQVDEASKSVAALQANPFWKQYGHPVEIRLGRNRKRQVNLFDPDGTRTELMEAHTVDGVPAPSSDAPLPSTSY